jgi:hypothetical protein
MKQEITVPESWQDIRVYQYKAFLKSIKPYEKVEDYEKIKLEKAMSHFCNISSEEISKLPLETYNGVSAYIENLFIEGQNLSLVKKFVLGETKYGFIPSLDEMSYGEYLDLSTYAKDTWDNISTILSVLYRPILKESGETYKLQPYNGTEENTEILFNKALTMDIVWGAIGFFTHLQQDLVNAMLGYSVKRVREMEIDSQVVETLVKNGVDISQLESLHKMISQNLKR